MEQLLSMTMSDYQAVEAISNSGLKEIAKSPAHYQAWKKEKPAASKAMTFGSALHCALLEPDKFTLEYAQAPDVDKRTKAYLEWVEKNKGKTPISFYDFEDIKEMQKSFFVNPLVRGVLKEAHCEKSIFWDDVGTGVKCKARPDIVTSGIVIDLKTTGDASPKAFAKDLHNFRYHVQAAMYLSGVTNATGIEHKEFIFIAIEKTAPFAIAVYRADDELLKRGHAQMQIDLDTYAKCVRDGVWPSYPEVVQTISLPAWV